MKKTPRDYHDAERVIACSRKISPSAHLYTLRYLDGALEAFRDEDRHCEATALLGDYVA